MSFSERLKKLRQAKQYTQEELAEKIFVSRQTISKWESNNVLPEIDNLETLSQVFDVSIDYLVNGQERTKKMSKRHLLNLSVLILGLIILVVSLVSLLVNPQESTTPSSTIEISIFVFLLIISILLIVLGMIMTYRSK